MSAAPSLLGVFPTFDLKRQIETSDKQMTPFPPSPTPPWNRSLPRPVPMTFGTGPCPGAEQRFHPPLLVGYRSGVPQATCFLQSNLAEILAFHDGERAPLSPILSLEGWLNPALDLCLPPLAAPPIKIHVKFILPSFIKINQLSNAEEPLILASSVSW